MKKIFCSVLLALTFILLHGQDKPYIHFTEDDGLPGNVVMDVVRDNEGFIWIATLNGIAKFDGNRFIPVSDSNGNPINMAWALAAGEKNNIYVATFGRGIYEISGDTVTRIYHAPEKRQDRFRKLYYSSYHKMLIAGSNHGLFLLKDTSLINIPFKETSKVKSEVLSFTAYDSLIFFTSADEGLYRLTINRNNPERSVAEKAVKGLAYSCLVSDNVLYTGNFDSVFTVSANAPHRKELLSLVKKNMLIWSMAAASDGKLFIGGLGDERFKGGAGLYDPATRSYASLTNEANEESVNSVFPDSISGVTWLAADNGLFAFFESPFSYTATDEGDYIKRTGYSGDSLFILTGTGISYLKDGNIMPWRTNAQVMDKINAHYKRFPLIDRLFDNRDYPDPVTLVQSDNRLFVSSQRGAISIPDLRMYLPFAVGTFRVQPDEVSAYAFIKYSDLRFYPSIRDSLTWIIPKGPGGTARDISEILESGGALYCISHLGGLYGLRENKVFRLSEENSALENNMSDGDIDKSGNVWCLSARGKLFKVQLSDSLYIESTMDLSKAGIPGESFKWLKFHGNWLFIGTNKGLYVITRKSIDSGNPIISCFFNGNNGYDFISAENPVITTDGKFYVNTRNRIIRIDTVFNEYPGLDIYLSEILINGKRPPGGFELRSLRYKQRQLSFRLEAIKYPLSKNIRYRYMINKGNWVAGNHVDLHSPSPGKYEITLECINPEDMAPAVRVLEFSVMPPFWHSAWFFLVASFLLVVMVFVFLRFRISSIKKQHEEKAVILKRNAELHLRSLQIQMNPHFIFNALNAIQGFIITKETDESLAYLSKLASIIRSNLENASEEYVPLNDEISFLGKYISIESMRFGDSLIVDLHNNVSENDVMVPPMLIQPLIENAIQYSMGNGKVCRISINFDKTGDVLVIAVEDNGPGIAATKNKEHHGHKGMALKIISQRLSILNQMNNTGKNKIEFCEMKDGERVTGTRVTINLSCFHPVPHIAQSRVTHDELEGSP